MQQLQDAASSVESHCVCGFGMFLSPVRCNKRKTRKFKKRKKNSNRVPLFLLAISGVSISSNSYCGVTDK